MPDEHLVGACGLYCGACYHYRAGLSKGEHLLAEAARQEKQLDGFVCQGCRSSVLYIHPGCARCQIRSCCDEHGVIHCGLCPDLPCERIRDFQCDGRIHHRDVLANLADLKAKEPARWLAEQAQRWRCSCGASFSWYEQRCHCCGARLNSYAADNGEGTPQRPVVTSAEAFRKHIRQGREFEGWERAQWVDDEHKGIEFEAQAAWQGKRGRIDIKLEEATEGCTLVVELKATQWDKMLPHRVRPNALRHARQIWRYIEAELGRLDVQGVHPAVVYPTEPETSGRKEEVESVLNGQGIQVVWREQRRVVRN